MPPKETSAITDKDLQNLAIAMKCIEGPIDFTKFAQLGGYNNAATARAMFNRLRKKFNLGQQGEAGSKTVGGAEAPVSPPATPKKGAKAVGSGGKGRKRSAAVKDEGEESEQGDEERVKMEPEHCSEGED